MANLGDMFGKIGLKFGGGGGGSFITTVSYILLGVVLLGLCVLSLWWLLYKRTRWNIKVEFKLPRDVRTIRKKDGNIWITGNIKKEWGKGVYDTKNGVVYLKRRRKPKIAMKPFDIKRALSDSNILTVLQVGADDYKPILEESYLNVVDDLTGEEGVLLKIKIDTSESKSWKSSFERESKMAYSIKSWLSEHGGIVAMGLVLLMNLVGFAIVLSRVKGCG